MDDALTAASIAPSLRGRFGDPLRYFPSIGSTNEDAMKWEFLEAAKEALDAAGIEIPFPHLSVYHHNKEFAE